MRKGFNDVLAANNKGTDQNVQICFRIWHKTFLLVPWHTFYYVTVLSYFEVIM